MPAGEVCVLIGPSGCGKTTTMRIINRMIEPDGGTVIASAGRDVMAVDPVELRRSIGYVIQQIGLFPHWSIARQHRHGAAPAALGRSAHRAARRRAAGAGRHGARAVSRPLSARAVRRAAAARRRRARARRRSAGHADGRAVRRDRSDHAHAAAGRVPGILRALEKTIVFVTHDIDEALKMGDRIAILRDGALVQYDTPEAILARPADAFVESFVGTDRALKRLALDHARDAALEPVVALAHAHAVVGGRILARCARAHVRGRRRRARRHRAARATCWASLTRRRIRRHALAAH